MKINGIKTINHEIIAKPVLHNICNNNVISNIIRNFKNAELYKPLKMSIII